MRVTFQANVVKRGLPPFVAKSTQALALPEKLHTPLKSTSVIPSVHRNLGFTLMELLLIVFLLGVISVIAVSALDGGEDQGLYEATRAEMVAIAKSLRQFRQDNGEFPCRAFRLDGNFVLDESNMTLLDMPTAPSNSLQRKVWCEGVSGESKDNALSMLIKFPFDAELYSDLLWDKDTKRGWRGPYLSGAGVSTDAWGTSYRLLDAELDYDHSVRCEIVADQYECLSPGDIGYDPGGKHGNVARIVSAGPNRLFGSDEIVDFENPCVSNDSDDLVLCILRN